MLFDKEEINTFCFTNGKCLFPNDFHRNYMICTVKCTFHLIIDLQSLRTFYLLFAEIFLIFWIQWDIPHLVYVKLCRLTLSNLHIGQKPKYVENEVRYWETENAFQTHLLRSELDGQLFRLRTPVILGEAYILEGLFSERVGVCYYRTFTVAYLAQSRQPILNNIPLLLFPFSTATLP